MKKRGFGEGKWNGYGGKVEQDESVEQAIVREVKEEMDVELAIADVEKVAEIDFFFADVPKEKGWDQIVHVFFARSWKGEPKETDEMKPQWFGMDEIPIDKMWVDDPHWLPLVFEGKIVKAQITFGKKRF